jgi:uncharacterized protein (DUF1684 family)
MKLFIRNIPAGVVFTSMLVIAIGITLVVSTPKADQSLSGQQHDAYRQSIEAWRAARHERLSQPAGWLSLVGLEWLKEGENRVGSAMDNDIRLGSGPLHWGNVFLQDGHVRFTSADIENVKIDGESTKQADLIPDTEGKPTVVTSGALSFHVIFRESFGLRIKDSKAKALLNFTGVENYPIDESWRIDGRFIQAEEGTSIEIANVLGQVSESSVFGTFEFERSGKTHRLLGLGTSDSKKLWFIFADQTSGRGSYGAGRFLYTDSMPVNGWLTVDFNKAYNPPCAFNPWSTCPLPPQVNRMDLAVTAGEKDFHPASG